MSKAPLVVIAAGGTGGHMFPAQSLADVMLRRGWRVKLSTDARGVRYCGGFSHAVVVEQVASATFAHGSLAGRVSAPFHILGGILGAARRMRRDRPAVVVGFGGYPTIPAVAAAWLLRLPRMIHEQNGVLGRVNTVFARRVDKVACGTWPMPLPEGAPGVHVGNPVRSCILDRAAAGYIPPGDYPMSILVIGGSQGAKALSDIVPEAISLLPENILKNLRLAHQAREDDMAQVACVYAGYGIAAEVAPFFRDVARRMSEAQLVISRSGASSIADIAVIGRPSILIPFPHATADHQTANAKGLSQTGAAVVIPESKLTPERLAEQIATILGQPDAAMKMAKAALGVAMPNAPQVLADMVEDLAAKGQKP